MLNGAGFGDFDRNAKQAVWNWPNLSYGLTLSRREKGTLQEALEAYHDGFPDPVPSDSKKVHGVVSRSLKAVRAGKVESVGLSISHKNEVRLGLDAARYPVMGETVASPVDAWLRDTLPQAHLFSPSEELADSVTPRRRA